MRQVASAILGCAIVVAACDESPSTNLGVSGLRPVSIRVDGPAELTPPAQTRYTALQTWSDGSTRDVSATAVWTSTNPSVLSISAGVAQALIPGEVGLTARVDPHTSQPKSVRVMSSQSEWEGTYTLTIGGGACNNTSRVLPAELRQRTYIASVRQSSLTLDVSVANVGSFGGTILNPQARFYFLNAGLLGHRLRRAEATEMPAVRIRPATYRRVGYWAPISMMFIEKLPDSNRLAITGEAVTTMSPSGFAGTLNGVLSLHEPSNSTLLSFCISSTHGFTLVRR